MGRRTLIVQSAKLNARGVANSGPAYSHFEYWLTGSTRHLTEPAGSWPAGASGPYSKTVTRLAADADYSFRVCGQDQDAQEGYCAQTRTFKIPGLQPRDGSSRDSSPASSFTGGPRRSGPSVSGESSAPRTPVPTPGRCEWGSSMVT